MLQLIIEIVDQKQSAGSRFVCSANKKESVSASAQTH
jgi:hypothetical protein